uniref:NADH dehydrogenase subunit 3 n=1 Tax=Eleutherocaulis alte TaxID=74076 RepID=UPI0023D8AC92|nr:NADH dehydrogenase subunit 3 [Eleutherocaulis alte]WDD39316.1 NADH dehydrogenase subunit 3 [Eleutherocaulis alte]
MLASIKHSFAKMEKKTPFECGFEPLFFAQIPYSTRFFLLLLLFLIFDIEAALLYPFLSMKMTSDNINQMYYIWAFLLVLFIGLIHEWHEGTIDWLDSKVNNIQNFILKSYQTLWA